MPHSPTLSALIVEDHHPLARGFACALQREQYDVHVASGSEDGLQQADAYHPDVVIVEGGPDAVRSVSANGLVWTIKGDAGHAGDLAPGKILFVTGRSAGRVLGVHRDGDDLVVTIGPVELTVAVPFCWLFATSDPPTE